ncbi:tetratricopeptide repeat-containing glycosyltransferase family 2 protein [Caldithrix abyssi]
MKKQTLSVCMIVKNEERFIADCLKSIQEVADQIVVLDTGSTDQTVEIARGFGAEIHHFNWCDDFAAARNASIKYAKGDWILWLDADERLLPESVTALKKVLKPEKKAVAYVVNIRNVMADGKTFKLSTGHRLFNNRKKIYFEGRVHEQIVYSLARNGGEERPSEIQLLHLGYALSSEEQSKKDQRNRQLLLKMVEEQPHNAYAHYTLGQNYNLSGEFEKALKHYLIALKKNHFQLSLQRQLLNNISEAYLKLNDLANARSFALKSAQLQEDQIGAYYLLYKIAKQQNQPDKAIKWLQTLREKNLAAQHGRLKLENDVLLSDADVLLSLGELFIKNDQLTRAQMCFDEIFLHGDNNRAFVSRIVEVWAENRHFARAEQFLEAHLSSNDGQFLELKGLLQIKQENYIGAIQTYTTLFQLQPNNLDIIKRLAGLFYKIGEKEKAESLIKMAADLNALTQKARV